MIHLLFRSLLKSLSISAEFTRKTLISHYECTCFGDSKNVVGSFSKPPRNPAIQPSSSRFSGTGNTVGHERPTGNRIRFPAIRLRAAFFFFTMREPRWRFTRSYQAVPVLDTADVGHSNWESQRILCLSFTTVESGPFHMRLQHGACPQGTKQSDNWKKGGNYENQTTSVNLHVVFNVKCVRPMAVDIKFEYVLRDIFYPLTLLHLIGTLREQLLSPRNIQSASVSPQTP